MLARWVAVSACCAAILAAVAGVSPSSARVEPRTTGSSQEYGVAVVFSDTPPLSDTQEIAQARKVFAYIEGLGANAVSLNFFFYQASQTSDSVSSGSGTPSPDVLKAIIEVAEADGLTVQLRPLMSESVFDTPITGAWRGSIVPSNPAAWFASYEEWLKPYAVVAEETGVTSFAIGSELNTLVTATPTTAKGGEPTIGAHNYLNYWAVLYQDLQSILGDRLVYADSHLIFQTVPGTQFGFDAWTPVKIPSGDPTPTSTTPAATVVGEFEPSMLADFASSGFPSTLQTARLEEVGIAAVQGAWTQPNDYNYPVDTPVARWVQADWFTAMCDAFKTDHMKGMYVWDVDFNTFSPTYDADTAGDIYNFEGTSAQTALESCFASLRG